MKLKLRPGSDSTQKHVEDIDIFLIGKREYRIILIFELYIFAPSVGLSYIMSGVDKEIGIQRLSRQLRTLACLSYILGITRVGNELGFGPRQTKEVGRIGEVLPLSMEGLKTDRTVVRLLNLSYPAVYYAKGLQERLKR